METHCFRKNTRFLLQEISFWPSTKTFLAVSRFQYQNFRNKDKDFVYLEDIIRSFKTFLS